MIRIIKVGRACEDSLSSELIRIPDKSRDQNNGYIDQFGLLAKRPCHALAHELGLIGKPNAIPYGSKSPARLPPPRSVGYIMGTCLVWSALHGYKAANCQTEHTEVVHKNTFYPIKDKTPLMMIAQHKKPKKPEHNQITQLLLNHKAHVNNTDRNGNTALMLAIQNKNTDAATLLCLAGADTSSIYQTESFHKAKPAIKNIIETIERSKYLFPLLTQHLEIPSSLASIILEYNLSNLDLACDIHTQNSLIKKFINSMEKLYL